MLPSDVSGGYWCCRTGEVAACIADADAVEQQLTPERIQAFAADIWSSSMLVVDANMSQAALQAACSIASAAGVPVLMEPVSVPKAVR